MSGGVAAPTVGLFAGEGTYYQVMNNYRVGATVPFTVQRGGQTITVQVTLEP
ncbi:hypothetical protein HXP44_29455 [Streptomyces sioyaensis]|uniref:hypothetical protein n=1 Tax=Streptomyces sioyaensis TaxID=67364 RepID=UPI0012AB8003|nr:hypothetical protein [Streptomyces sioyaensis]MBM4796052.1 hypothetical protein [Streptomyces sioyaensis]